MKTWGLKRPYFLISTDRILLHNIAAPCNVLFCLGLQLYVQLFNDMRDTFQAYSCRVLERNRVAYFALVSQAEDDAS